MRYLIILIMMPFIQLGVSFVGQELLFIPNSVVNRYGLVFVQQLCSVLIPTCLLFRKKRYLPKSEYRTISFTEIIRFAMIGIALQFIGIALNTPISILLQKMGHAIPKSLPNAKNLPQFLLQIFVVCLSPAIFEEVLFRRMIFDNIRHKSNLAAVVFSSLFFSMAHLDLFNIPATFCIGICLGLARIRGIPLLYCIITHFFVNFSATVLNQMLERQSLNELIQRYFPLGIFLSCVILIVCFPKKQENAQVSLKLSNSFFRYIATLLKNPLFYGYCILFAILGVYQL